MSEVVGAILVFGILSTVLVMAMLAFGTVEADVRDRVVALHAQGTADRIAGVVVQAGLFAENQGPGSTFAYGLDLPTSFEGRSFRVAMVPRDHADLDGDGDYELDCDETPPVATPPGPCDGDPGDRIVVAVPEIAAAEETPLYAASAPTGFTVCPSVVAGGPIWVRFGPDPSDPASECLYLDDDP